MGFSPEKVICRRGRLRNGIESGAESTGASHPSAVLPEIPEPQNP
jgi:hypothetical protein